MASEVELKLAIDAKATSQLLQHPALRAISRAKSRRQRLASTYFDSPTLILHRENVALRIRRAGGRWIQTIKGPPQSGATAGLQVRSELEWPVKRPTVDSALLASTAWRKLVAKIDKNGGFIPVCTTDFQRTTLPLTFPDGSVAELCIDIGEVRAVRDRRTRRAPISEIEIELESGDVANVYRLALALSEQIPLAVMTESKAARGYALRRGKLLVTDSAVRATATTLPAAITIADALSSVARECLQHIGANVRGVLENDDPEWIHQMRVGTRRLRSCLSLMSSLAPGAALTSIEIEAKWLAGMLGLARDLDVFAKETLPALAEWSADPPPSIRRLRARLAIRRCAARSAARAAVASPRFQRLLLNVGLICAIPNFGAPERESAPETSKDPLQTPATEFAANVLARRHRKLVRRSAALTDESDEERHQARIAAKRFRYAAEFFASLYPRKRTRSYLKALMQLQEELGSLNDASIAVRLTREMLGTSEEIVGTVRAWAARKARKFKTKLAKVHRRFEAAKPFWSD